MTSHVFISQYQHKRALASVLDVQLYASYVAAKLGTGRSGCRQHNFLFHLPAGLHESPAPLAQLVFIDCSR